MLFYWGPLQVKKSCHHHVCSRGRLCGSFCLQKGEGAAPPLPPAFWRPSRLAIKQQASCHHHACSRRRLCGLFRLQIVGPSMFALKQQASRFAVLAVREGCGLCLPQPLLYTPTALLKPSTPRRKNMKSSPCGKGRLCGSFFFGGVLPRRFFKASHAYGEKIVSSLITIFAVLEACADHCLQMRGGCARPIPRFSMAIHACNKNNKHQVVIMFAVEIGCAKFFVCR